jgi:hypothetical protein
MIFVALLAVMTLPLLSAAKTQMVSLTIVNNSNREIRHVYFSHVDLDDWTGDKLNNSVISPGQSGSIANFSWDQQQVKVIGEDQEGCFLSGVVASDGSPTWTITSETPVDCGNNGVQANQ